MREWAAMRCSGYKGPELLHLTIMFRDRKSFIEQPEGSNSTEHLLSVVNWCTDMMFLISCGDTRTLLRRKDPDRLVVPVTVTGSNKPLPTTIEEGAGKYGTDVWERVPTSEVI